jgi:large subunit ribosomal protein L9
VALDKKKIHLEHPIRTLGEHEVELRLHQGVVTTLKVLVQSTTPLPEPVEPPPAERRDDRRTEKRGRRPEPAAQVEAPAEKPAKAAKPAKAEKAEKGEKPERKPRAVKGEKGGDDEAA